ncbi:ABC-2 family transporter protein [Fructilactobacillus cliffordii]|uniref:ABC-2 family transporter protein n=1 Tax=Fructilactobacillus cliffordii TaxID=2940299 RepID=A0A9Q8ZNR0_9LACO|nr:ABC-2 family transporter protein [Fructilactobacillus cliffordii]USS88794.1 ABC-2 family transporter protein [Fructilactobacillus cliffordii]
MSFRLYGVLAQQSFKTFLTYRMTSVLVVLFGFMFTAIEIAAGFVYYSFAHRIGGLNFLQYEILIMSLTSITTTYQFLFVGAHESLAGDLIDGNLDYLFLRPLPSYWYYALRQLDFPSGVNLLVYIPATVFLLTRFPLSWSAWSLILVIYVVGVLFVFALNQIVVEISFWYDNLTALNGVPEDVISAASRPARIYPRWLQLILSTSLPVLALSNGIVTVTVKQSTAWQMLVPLAIVTVLLLVFSFYLWQRGTRHYVSAN